MGITTVTVLFTDLVGSTELSVAHGARFDEARRAHDALLRAAVERNAGTVVKGLGDGIMATFPSASDAVAASRAIQQAIHRHNAQGHEPALAVRTGLAVGDVTIEGDDCFGEPVILAARLCAVATGGEILAADLVQALAGGRRAGGFADRGEMRLKGLPDPIDVVEIEWDASTASTTPLPARLAQTAASFVGRSDELVALDRAYDAVCASGQRRVVFVSGEPGLGKTTVVAHATREWHSRGATVAMGWCEEDLRAPYRAFVDALAHLVSHAPTEVLRDHVDRHGAGVLPIAPGLARRVGTVPEAASSDPETERFLLFSAADDLFAALSADAPLVVFLDDLHWADDGTASLLSHLAASTTPARLLLVGTFRRDELAPDHPMTHAVAALHRVPSVEHVHLGGLRDGDVVELVTRWTGVDAGPTAAHFATSLVAETGGNAFFVTEVMRHLDETGQLAALTIDDDSGRDVMPDSVRAVLGARVARLGTAAEDVLGTAAVIGSEFDLSVVTAVTGLGDEKVLAILQDAARAALVRELPDSPGRFLFAHALVQHAILANLGATRTASLHRRVAETLEATGADGGTSAPVAQLAHHWLQATRLSDNSRARDWARQAGEEALAALAPGDAVVFFRQALLLHDQIRDADPATRIDLLTALGTAERLAGDPEHRDTWLKACRLARRAGDGARLSAAALTNHRGTFSTFGGVDTERIEMLDAAIATCDDEATRALLLATLANELTYSGDFDRRREIADRALDAARRAGDDTLLLRVMNLVFYPLWVPDTLAERLAMTEESMALLAHVEEPQVRYWAAITNYLNLVQAGRIEDSEALLAETCALADRLAQPALQWRARHTQATRAALAGDPDASEHFLQAALELGIRAGEGEATVYQKSQTTIVHWQRGTLGDVAARIGGRGPRPANAVAVLCLIFAEGGRVDDCHRLLDTQVAEGFRGVTFDPAYIATLSMFAEAAVHTGRVDAAAPLYDGLLPYASQIGFDGVTTVGALEHPLGALARLLGHHDDAVARLTRAAAVHAAVPAPFFEARSRLELALALRARAGDGDETAAREQLERAAALARGRYPKVHERVLAHSG